MKVKIALVFWICFFGFPYITISQTKDTLEKRDIKELRIRGGLPNFFEKAFHGGPIKIAYLGGSITAQEGWRVLSLEWFQQRFPKVIFSEINAAIGGTDSEFGVFRLHNQVLEFNPDLVFVEFAVNDSNNPLEKIICSMEGIVRQIRQHNPSTDICFIYTIKDTFLETEQNGHLPSSIMAMEKIADQYGIPGINFGLEVSNMVSNNHLIFKGASKELNGREVFSPDGVHPYLETGHIIYLNVLKRSFETMASGKKLLSKKHILHKSLSLDYFSNPKMVDLTKVRLSKNWKIFKTEDQPLFSSFCKYLNKIGKGQSGETLTVHFKGKAIGAYDVMGPDAGKVIVEIDGLVKDTISRFDEYCTYWRMNYFVINHLKDKNHVVVFRVLSEPFVDKVAILARIGEVIRNPVEYKENNWYVGKILIDGYLLP